MDAGQLAVRFEIRDSACVVKLDGELTVFTDHELTARVTRLLAMLRVPVLFDVSGLDFVDCHGARALAATLRTAAPRETGLYGCRPAVRRSLEMLGFDLPYVATLVRELPAPPPPPPVPVPVGPLTRRADLTALIRANKVSTRQSATRASEIMTRLATTYSQLALNGRYRTPYKSEERGRLLALSGQARDLSRRYLSHAAAPVGGAADELIAATSATGPDPGPRRPGFPAH